MRYLRLLLFPFSIVYGCIVYLRNLLYDLNVFKSYSFNIPVICIGNLAVGGAGKSPQAEYLVRLLRSQYRIAILSRGYGRDTKGFRVVNAADTAKTVGDEPLQFFRKFGAGLTVAVCERRKTGIERLMGDHDLIILDDAFQHREVRAGFNILLFDFNRMDRFKLPLPAGDYREPFSGMKRAQAIIVTKVPDAPVEGIRKQVLEMLGPAEGQQVFWSRLKYGMLRPLFGGPELSFPQLAAYDEIFLITGIANPLPLVTELRRYNANLRHYDYPDHHPFTKKNISKLAGEFALARNGRALIISTEKDAQRLRASGLRELLDRLPVYYVPVEAELLSPGREEFDDLIKNYVSEHL